LITINLKLYLKALDFLHRLVDKLVERFAFVARGSKFTLTWFSGTRSSVWLWNKGAAVAVHGGLGK
jgi:hypothetical protein